MEFKDKSQILNDVMDSAASLIAGKIDFTEIIIEQFKDKNDNERVLNLEAELKEMQQALATIVKYAGCWS